MRNIAKIIPTLLLTMWAPSAVGQQPTVFVHGGLNDGSSWQLSADYLKYRFHIMPLLPTLGWSDRIPTQADRLRSAVAGYSSLPALAHSNGGLVARRSVQSYGTGASLNRLATIGTGHQGLFLATNALAGFLGAWGQNIIGAIGEPLWFYSTYDPDWWWLNTYGLGWAAANMQRFGDWIPFGVANGLGVAAAFPVSFDLTPGDQFTGGLNSASALSAEASVLGSRVGISTMTRPQNMMMRTLLSNWQTWSGVRWSLWGFALAMRGYYATHHDWFLASNAWRWELMALRMIDLDVVWNWQIGALHSAQCSAFWCWASVYPSDGLVPVYSQQYPNANRQIFLSDHDIPHTAQKNAFRAREAFEDVFRNNFLIPDAPASDPPPDGGDDCVPVPPQIACAA